MRIVERNDFLTLPSGVLYRKYDGDDTFGDLCIKLDSLDNDWYYIDVSEFDDWDDSEERYDRLSDMQQDRDVSYNLQNNVAERDGLFNDFQLFLVYSKQDVQTIISTLKEYCL